MFIGMVSPPPSCCAFNRFRSSARLFRPALIAPSIFSAFCSRFARSSASCFCRSICCSSNCFERIRSYSSVPGLILNPVSNWLTCGPRTRDRERERDLEPDRDRDGRCGCEEENDGDDGADRERDRDRVMTEEVGGGGDANSDCEQPEERTLPANAPSGCWRATQDTAPSISSTSRDLTKYSRNRTTSSNVYAAALVLTLPEWTRSLCVNPSPLNRHVT